MLTLADVYLARFVVNFFFWQHDIFAMTCRNNNDAVHKSFKFDFVDVMSQLRRGHGFGAEPVLLRSGE